MKELLYPSYYSPPGKDDFYVCSLDYKYIPVYAGDRFRETFRFLEDSPINFNKLWEGRSYSANSAHYPLSYLCDSLRRSQLCFLANYFVTKGFISNDNNVLLCLCTTDVKTITSRFDEIDVPSLRLFIAEELMTSPQHKDSLLVDNVKSYISDVRKYNIPVILCENIVEEVFKEEKQQIFEFKDFTEFYSEMNRIKEYYFYDFNDKDSFEEFLIKEGLIEEELCNRSSGQEGVETELQKVTDELPF